MEQEESGGEQQDRDGGEESSFADVVREAVEAAADDSGESESESERNSSSVEPSEDSDTRHGQQKSRSGMRRQAREEDAYDSLGRTSATGKSLQSHSDVSTM